jgi:outer membrane protein assembly factor BamA
MNRLFKLTVACLFLPALMGLAQEVGEVRLREMSMSGLPEMSLADLQQLTGLTEGQQYSLMQLDTAEDTLRSRIQTLVDYPFVTVQSWEIELLSGGRSANINATLDPGPEIWVRSLELSGPLAGQERRLKDGLQTTFDEQFRTSTWQQDLENSVAVLRDQGYPFAQVLADQITPKFGSDTVFVDLVMTVQPGARVTFSRVDFAGLERTRPTTARQAARLSQQVYSPEVIERARRRLMRTDWFYDVSAGEVFRDRDGDYGVLYEVREQPTSSVAGAIGYAAGDEGLAGSFDATLANMFGGGRAFDLHWRRDSPESRAFSVAYLEPFLFGQALDMRLHLAQEVRDSQYVAVEFGGELSARLADEWTLTGSLRRKNITSDSLAADADTTDYSLVGAGVAVEYDTRDRRTNPRSGAYARIGSERLFVSGERTAIADDGELATKDLAGMYRSEFDAEFAFPVRGEWVGFLGLHGVSVEVDGGERPPIAEWEQLGGATTVRGYAERSLIAPTAGWGTAELRYLLGSQSRAYTLFDVAALDVQGENRWEWSYGAGIQVDTGIGLLNIAVAVPGGEGFSAAVVHAQAVARF